MGGKQMCVWMQEDEGYAGRKTSLVSFRKKQESYPTLFMPSSHRSPTKHQTRQDKTRQATIEQNKCEWAINIFLRFVCRHVQIVIDHAHRYMFPHILRCQILNLRGKRKRKMSTLATLCKTDTDKSKPISNVAEQRI